MRSRGVIYVATKQDRYLEEAFLSAESIKSASPGIPITLFTDRQDHALCDAGVFDRVEPITPDTGFRSSWADGQISRLRCLPRSPYAETLHLDTDTRVFTPALAQVFDLLNSCDVAMVEDRADYSSACKLSGLRMFNAGFVLYRRAPEVDEWLTAWIEKTARNFRYAVETPLPNVEILAHIEDEETKRHLLSMDQISLVELLSPERNGFRLRAGVLDRFWNYRGPLAAGDSQEQIQIIHSDDIRKVTLPDILAVAHRWVAEGNPAAARLYDYVASFQPQYCRPRSWLPWKRPIAERAEWATPGLKRADLHLLFGQTDKAVGYLAKEDRAEMMIGVARAELIHGRVDDALELARTAQAQDSHAPYANLVLGQILLAAGRHLEATRPLKVAVQGGAPGACFLLGQAWFALNDFKSAATAFEAALEENGSDARNNLMVALVGLGRYRDALTCADILLTDKAWHVPAIAFKGIALAELGRSAAETFDHDSYAVAETLQVPDDYETLEAFNAALSQAITSDPTLVYEPAGHATRHGGHTGDLSQSRDPAIRALNKALLGVAENRMRSLQTSDHPFTRAKPRLYRLYSWAVVMDREGHQTPHIHSNGWLSGVYYVDVPDDVRLDDPDQNGWLEFGQGEARWHRRGNLPRRTVMPKPGLVVTFPSYFWHNTRPLRSDKPRISFAFDIVPA